jgi:hypothetical protein
LSAKEKYVISEKEIEVSNLFSKLGYFTRCHLQIYPTDLKNNASDIDVIAIKHDSHLVPETILIEVKEGYGRVSELFQVFGFKSYFQPTTTYLVSREILEVTKHISKKLGIHALTFERLNEIVQKDLRYATERKWLSVPLERKDLERIIDHLLAIKKMHEDLYWKYHYLWLETDPYLKLFSLQNLFSLSRDLENASKETDVKEAIEWYQQEIFCLSVLATLSIAYDCMDLAGKDISEYIQDRFYNIGTSKEGKMKVKRGVDTLIQLIDKLSKGSVKVDPIEVIPNYVDSIVDLVKFIISNSSYIQYYLTIDSNVQKLNLKGKGDNFRHLAVSELQSEMVEKLNTKVLSILYNGKPVSMTFKNFV